VAVTAKGIRAGRAYVELFADGSGLVRGLRAAEHNLRQFGRNVRNLGAQMLAASAMMAAPFVASIKAAGDAIETINKFEQVFGDQAKAAGQFADALAAAVGRSRYEIRDSLASFHAFFLGFGFGEEQSRGLAQAMESLALDFASLYNIADSDAMAKFQSGLAGMPRTLRAYGINILDSTVQQEALAMGIAKGNAELTGQQKVLARTSIIMKTLTKQGVVGDAVRTAGQFINRMKALRGQLIDMAVDIGMTLMPIVTPLVDTLVKAAKAVGQWAKEHQAAIVMMAKVVAVVGLAGVALIGLGTAIQILGFALGGLATLIALPAKMFLGVIAVIKGVVLALFSVHGAVLVVGAALVHFSGLGGAVVQWLGERWTELKEGALEALGGIKDALVAGDLKLAARIMWLSLKVAWEKGIQPLRTAWAEFVFGLKAAWEVAMHAIAQVWNQFVLGLKTAWLSVKAFFLKSFEKVVAFLSKIIGKVVAFFDPDVDADELSRALEETSKERLADIESEKKAALDAAGAEYAARRKAEDDLHQRRMADIGREGAARVESAEDALKKARKEWQDAIEQARTAREKAEKEGTAAALGTDALKDLLRGLLGASAGGREAATVVGTFSAEAIGGLGTGSAMDRTALATEATARHTRKLVDQAAEAGLAFT